MPSGIFTSLDFVVLINSLVHRESVRLVNVSFCTRCAEAVSCCSCHLQLLYIGLECGLTNNVKLADKFFLQSQSIAPQDPFVMHEMGVICFQNHE